MSVSIPSRVTAVSLITVSFCASAQNLTGSLDRSKSSLFTQCSKNDLFNNDCISDDGIEVLEAGIKIARKFRALSSFTNVTSVSRVFGPGLSCVAIFKSAVDVSTSNAEKIKAVDCASYHGGTPSPRVPNAVIYDTQPRSVSTLHWQLEMQFSLPANYDSLSLASQFFLRTTFPRHCPRLQDLSGFPSAGDTLLDTSITSTRSHPYEQKVFEPTANQVWLLAADPDQKAYIRLNEYKLFRSGLRCEALISITTSK